jgi:hypothetical protein
MSFVGRGIKTGAKAAGSAVKGGALAIGRGASSAAKSGGKLAKGIGSSVKKSPWEALSVLSSIPFLAMMFMPVDDGGYAEGDGQVGGSFIGSPESISSVCSSIFSCFCFCILMMTMIMLVSSAND